MSTVQASVSDMLVTVKAREVQRGMLAEMGAIRPVLCATFSPPLIWNWFWPMTTHRLVKAIWPFEID